MSTLKEAVEVAVPIHTAYNQWTQFEEFPRFMEGVEEVSQLDDTHNHWTTKIGGVRREFDTEIVDQLADEKIAWRTTGGDVKQMGMVRFQSVDNLHTRVELIMDIETSGPHGESSRHARSDGPAGQGRHAALQGVHRSPRR